MVRRKWLEPVWLRLRAATFAEAVRTPVGILLRRARIVERGHPCGDFDPGFAQHVHETPEATVLKSRRDGRDPARIERLAADEFVGFILLALKPHAAHSLPDKSLDNRGRGNVSRKVWCRTKHDGVNLASRRIALDARLREDQRWQTGR